jgi:hypothetical protein
MYKPESPCYSHCGRVSFKRPILWHQHPFQYVLGQTTDSFCGIALSAKGGVSNNGNMGNLLTPDLVARQRCKFMALEGPGHFSWPKSAPTVFPLFNRASLAQGVHCFFILIG